MNLPANTLIRFLQAKAVGAGDPLNALGYAKSQFGPSSTVVDLLQKEVMGTTNLGSDPDFLAAGRGFMELVRSRSLIGKITAASAFRKIPFETRILRQLSNPIATWTAEGQLIPVTGTDFENTSLLSANKVAGIIPMTNELLKGAGANFEAAISRDLSRAVADLESTSFIDPANAGQVGVSPASITYGITPLSFIGGDSKPYVQALIDTFQGDLETAVFVTTPTIGTQLYNDGFLGAGALGGEVAGLPLVTSGAVPDGFLGLIDPSGIILADDGVLLDLSDQTTLTLEDDSVVSLWQLNLSAIKATRLLNWLTVREGSVAYFADMGQ
ncbi:phage major capsid protein [Pseudomonas luteola]|uniref:phage major capsid protein n=1 Tax=Pseudomonas luteola TaxID=47886 RepID=UPI00163AB737|nr:phage major capsid protein [Pseudomonas luteola]